MYDLLDVRGVLGITKDHNIHPTPDMGILPIGTPFLKKYTAANTTTKHKKHLRRGLC